MLNNNDVGKLKKTLKEKCEFCEKPLQLREKFCEGRKIVYKYCHVCDEEVETVDVIPLKNPFRSGEFVS